MKKVINQKNEMFEKVYRLHIRDRIGAMCFYCTDQQLCFISHVCFLG